MFTGFASENTPGVKVWDFTKAQAGTSQPRVSLEDDCAPNQIFFTGGSTNTISVYLPNASVSGKTVTIRNESASGLLNDQRLNVFDNAQNQTGYTYFVGAGQTIVFLSIDNLSAFTNPTLRISCSWIVLSGGQYYGGSNYGSSVLSGSNNRTAGSSAWSVIGGGSNNRSLASRACILGGDGNLGSGVTSFIGGGSNNTASGELSGILSGQANTASGLWSSVLGGFANTASGSQSCVVGGGSNSASGDSSIVVGGQRGTSRSILGNCVTPASRYPIDQSSGVQQLATLLLGRQTTDATATRLTSDTSAAATTNQVILPNNSAYTFQGTCIANVTGGGTTSGWKFEGVIKRGANAASTTLVAAVTPTVIAQDAGAAAWVLAITADTTNGGIAVTVTGAAATTIRWVVKIETTEVTF